MANSLLRQAPIALLGLACVVGTQGCGPNHSESNFGPLAFSGVRFKILYPLGVKTQSIYQPGGDHQDVFTFDCGKFKFEVIDARLKVNGRDYGILKADD